MKNDVVIKNSIQLLRQITAHSDAHNPAILKELFLLASPFLVPMLDPGIYEGPFLFDKHRADLIGMLGAPTEGSVVHKKKTLGEGGCGRAADEETSDSPR